MSTVISFLAIMVGASLPIIGLALYSRWRLHRVAARLTTHRLWATRIEVERRPVGGGSLAWLNATIGRPTHVAPPTATAFERRCPQCRYLATEPSAFCRRCGTRFVG